jgi:hypothetical protein
LPTFLLPRYLKGFSSHSSNVGNIRAIPITASRTMPIQRMKSCGRPRSESSVEPRRVTSVKETTSPRVTRSGYLRERERSSPVAALVAPARKMMGSIGRMHGDMPVISPPSSPMSA